MRNLSVATIYNPPWSYGNNHSKYPGLLEELVLLFCNASRYTCEIHQDETNTYGNYVNGTWYGIVDKLVQGQYNFSIPGFTQTVQRFDAVDFSEPLYTFPLILVSRRPDKDLSTFSFSFLVFNWSVWLSLIACCVFIGFGIAFLQINETNDYFCNAFCRYTLNSFSFLTSQAEELNISRTSVRFLVAFWALATVVLSGLYSGFLISFIIRTNFQIPFQDFPSFVDCVEKRLCLMVADSNLSFVQEIYTSEDQHRVRLKAALRKNKDIQLIPYKRMLEKIKTVQSTYVVGLMVHQVFLVHSNLNHHCEFSWVKIGFDQWSFAMPKKSPLKNQLNRFVGNIVQAGIEEEMSSKVLGGVEQKCESEKFVEESSAILSIKNFLGAIFVLLLGAFIATISCSVEILLKKQIDRAIIKRK